MSHLRVVIHIKLVAVFLRQPFASKAKPGVDPNTLVRDSNTIVLRYRLIRNVEALFSKRMNASRTRCAELSSELLISLNPVIHRRTRRHSRIATNAGKRLPFGRTVKQFQNHIVLKIRLAHRSPDNLAL